MSLFNWFLSLSIMFSKSPMFNHGSTSLFVTIVWIQHTSLAASEIGFHTYAQADLDHDPPTYAPHTAWMAVAHRCTQLFNG
jgi:hypothetical protein